MSTLIPFLAILLATGFASYHRWRMPVWAAITACLLLACWLLGANPTATFIAAAIAAIIAIPLLIGAMLIRKPEDTVNADADAVPMAH